ncbi:hypothetical protein CDA63_02310 [Hymenobacter amundsenii]|uniref:Peptidase M56 domain-containing protein n=1 Tax=Hymenobacter amundsenii TaxID=2006685 RepID=A0A246FPF9_9BACT|nr:M56 family metallopeptidase [Hymenobacter amundsenii]OWP64612.1 hypothetical protein CDA63_02310 [Hymenobacter amundsenii]
MIPALVLYLLQMQLALLLLLGLYYGLLRRLSFHQLNRGYLLAALVLAASYPALDLSGLLPAPAARVAQPLALLLPAAPVPEAAAIAVGPDYGAGLLLLYAVGVGLMLFRLLVQATSLWRLHRHSRPADTDGVPFRAVDAAVSPFSFGWAIYLNPGQHAPAELPVVVLHERVHVRQAHTVDVLMGHLHRALAWVSPAAWLWLRATQENLEFIADAAVLRENQLPARQYQHSLARLSALTQGPALTTPFSFLLLKNRIAMMNAQPSSARQLLRYAAVVPLAAVLLLTTAATTASPVVAPAASPTVALTDIEKPLASSPLVFLDGKRISQAELDKLDPQLIESMNVLKGAEAQKAFGSDAADGAILIITKQNKNSDQVRDFMRKYNIGLAPASPEVQRLVGLVTSGQGLSAADLQGRLLLVNGVEAPAEKSKIAESQLQGVFVLDAERAAKKYGEKARQGAVVITTK